ncbi:MAG: hypothetical protein QF898_07455 [SAR202 cluster bacterium]|nr:hypothetical protein [SAR202 cluster bacterium]
MTDECQIKLKQVVGYLTENLDTSQTQFMENHIEAGCGPCEARIESLLDLAATEVPIPVKNEMVAQPLFDTQLQPQPVGVRGGATLTRRRLYEAENKVCVDIEHQHSDDGIQLEGQILIRGGNLDEVSHTVVTLFREGLLVATSEVDFVGDFQVPGIQPGMYDLEITNADMNVTLQGFDIE